MKVLWFTNTPANADEYFNTQLQGTGGWLKALDKLLQNYVELHVAFYDKYNKPFTYQRTTYHPIYTKESLFTKGIRKLGFSFVKNKEDLKLYLEIIDSVKPDVIHIHGTENPFGCIITHTDKPVVVSIQGNITVYYHKFLNGFDKKYLRKRNINSLSLNSIIRSKIFLTDYNRFKKMSKIERANLGKTKYIIGRTDWDRRITRVLAPHSIYFHNDEILRNAFYENEWKCPNMSGKFIIYTTNGDNLYKGFETLCQSLKLLNGCGFHCEWRVAGIDKNDLIFHVTKKKLKSYFPETGLILLGKQSEQEIINGLLQSHLYVMTSHIENSPNNLCEAMILGMPCISTFAGGSGTLISDKVNGLLIQSGDPWAMAGAILEIAANGDLAKNIGINGREHALKRHNKERIVTGLISIYENVHSGYSKANSTI
ncbi:MAG: glycosyltransferase [Acholeplasma sp.]|nr:glycosyltransferase [Acholeplasma sp.]